MVGSGRFASKIGDRWEAGLDIIYICLGREVGRFASNLFVSNDPVCRSRSNNGLCIASINSENVKITPNEYIQFHSATPTTKYETTPGPGHRYNCQQCTGSTGRSTFFKHMVMQQTAFHACLQSFLEATNKRFDDVVRETAMDAAELKASLQFTQNEYIYDNIKKSLYEKSDVLENQTGRNNQRIDGVAEGNADTWADTEANVGGHRG